MESAATEPFAEWFTGEFLPFGDLVSDVWLWSTLPREKPEDYSCSAETYTVRPTPYERVSLRFFSLGYFDAP